MRGTTLLAAAALAAAVLFSVRVTHGEEEAGDAAAPVAAVDHLGAERHALVIGIDDYRDNGFADLRHPENDARGVLSVLVDPLTGGVPEANAQTLLGAEATAAGIRAALDGLQRLPKEATVFVYFAGHGAVDGENAYWVAQDSRKNDLPATAIGASEVQGLLDRARAERVFLMMDCRQAAGGRARGAHAKNLARYHGTGYATLGAAGSKAYTIGSQKVKHSVFTHYLIRGLAGKADADDNGIVVLSELAAYVSRRVGIETRKQPGLKRPVADLKGVREPSRFFLTIEPKGLGERLREYEEAQTLRHERLAALTTLLGEEQVTKEQARLGRHLLGVLPEGFESHELEQRTMFVDLAEGRLDPVHLTGVLAALRRADRKTLVVPDQFETIQAAIDASAAGDTVFVKAGGYDEHLVFKNGLRLRGEGRERSVIRMVPGEPEILLAEDCAWGSIERLQFDGSEGKQLENWFPDGIHLNRSSLRVSECLAYSCVGCGLYASGPKSRPYVRECTFEKNKQDGLCFSETESGVIVECISRSNGALGIAIRKSKGSITVRDCLCELCKQAGIGVCLASKATLEGNDCQRNTGHGILIWDEGTSVILEDNTCSRNEMSGIYLIQRPEAVVRGNVCSRNRESGFVAYSAGTRATVSGNQCLDNDLSTDGNPGGIVFRDGARGDVTSNTCDGNTCGILVLGAGTSVLVRDNTCRKNKTSGIEFTDAAPGHATGNQCDENEHGITVSSTEATLEGNTLARNTMHGIRIAGGGAGTASGNRCEENLQAGIHVTDAGTRAELLKNICTANGTHGIQFAKGAAGTADGNECSENKAFGIAASNSGTRPTFRRNRCTNNGRAGIGKERGAAPTIESNNVQTGNGE